MKTKFKTQRKGAVLMTVVVVSMMMVVIVGAAISLVYHTNYRTNKEYRLKQAYFAASSVLEAFVAETTSYTQAAGSSAAEITGAIDMLQSVADGKPAKVTINKVNLGGGEGALLEQDNPRWGNVEVTLSVEKVGGSDSSLKAISTATYLGQEKTVVAYLAIKPLNKKKSVLNALEMMSSNSGNQYNNINVYGTTAAPDRSTHDINALYDISMNDSMFYGDVQLYGSAISSDNMRFKANPYYYEKEYDSDDEERLEDLYTPGGVYRCSRSIMFKGNAPSVETSVIKTAAMDNNVNEGNRYYYNFIEAGEAFISCKTGGSNIGLPGSDGTIYDADAKMVDIYASLIYFGDPNTYKKELFDWCAASVPTEAGRNDYKSRFKNFGQGNSQNIYGNLYCYKPEFEVGSPNFKGDIYIDNTGTKIHGNVYCDGDLYLKDVKTCIGNIDGTIYISAGGTVRDFDTPTTTYTADQLKGLVGEGKVLYNNSWKDTVQRAQRPTPMENIITPYYYYPEHLMLEPSISTIHKTYRSFYGTGANTLNSTGLDDFVTKPRYKKNGASFVEDASGAYVYYNGEYIDVTRKFVTWDGGASYQEISWDADEYYCMTASGGYVKFDKAKMMYNAPALSGMRVTRPDQTDQNNLGKKVAYTGYEYPGGVEQQKTYVIEDATFEYKYKDKYGIEKTETLRPKNVEIYPGKDDYKIGYVITESCIWDVTCGTTDNVIIDLDHAKKNADGKYDIVIMMQKNIPLVNNQCPKILVKNFEHGPDSDDPRFVYFVSDSGIGTVNNEYADGVTPSTYDPATFKKAAYNVYENGSCVAKTYIMNLVDYCHSSLCDDQNSLDPTGRELGEPVYDLGSGGIFFMLTEGCSMEFCEENIVQANIYMPKADYIHQNSGKYMNIEPASKLWGDGMLRVNIIGSLCCKNYKPSANNNTIVYQPASTQSMLAFVHGVEKEAAKESFQLVRYAAA